MSAVEDFQASTEDLASSTERDMAGIYAGIVAGTLSTADAITAIALVVNRANARATGLGDLYVSQAIEEAIGEATPSIGILPVDHSERLLKAAETILVEPPTDATPEDVRLARLARCEPLEVAQKTVTEAMIAHPLVEGWVRQMDADPCQLCQWWSRGGRVWPKQHPFQSHKGCNCQPRIVLVKNIQSTGFTRRLRRG